MEYFAQPLSRLIEEFEKMPGIGHKTAQRLAFYVLGLSDDAARALAEAILQAKSAIQYCRICQNLTDKEICDICSARDRDTRQICVVEDTKDLIALEKTREYKGVYHVLGGVISPMNGVGPDDLKTRELLQRVSKGEVDEVIMATNPTLEGETTAMYISRLLRPLGIKVTRLAYGIPVGADLEYADELTLLRALEGRREIT